MVKWCYRWRHRSAVRGYMKRYVNDRVHGEDYWAYRFYPEGKIPYKEQDAVKGHDDSFIPYETCSYCGSLSPEAALELLEKDVSASGADWKYGWPHKFYIKAAKNGAGKFYSRHLYDADTETLNKLTEILDRKLGIFFILDDKGLRYSAPYFDYQTWVNSGHDDEAPKDHIRGLDG